MEAGHVVLRGYERLEDLHVLVQVVVEGEVVRDGEAVGLHGQVDRPHGDLIAQLVGEQEVVPELAKEADRRPVPEVAVQVFLEPWLDERAGDGPDWID